LRGRDGNLLKSDVAEKLGGAAITFAELTQREREVLELIARGLDNAAIASQLSVSPKTVRNHINGIFDKLSIPNRAQAIVRAREAGMGTRTG
jgi:DNA-binding NarL/FixJ family response regulator